LNTTVAKLVTHPGALPGMSFGMRIIAVAKRANNATVYERLRERFPDDFAEYEYTFEGKSLPAEHSLLKPKVPLPVEAAATTQSKPTTASELFNDVTRSSLTALRRVLEEDPFDLAMGEKLNMQLVRQQVEAAQFVISTAINLDKSALASNRGRAKRLATLQSEIDELQLEAQRVAAEASVAALKKRAR
jgi:hypothetical protein